MRFDMICEANGIEHRLTKPNHPWSSEDQKTIRGIVFPRDGQVERMNRTIKESTVKRYHYDSHDQLRAHLADFIAAYNFARRLKTLSGLTCPLNLLSMLFLGRRTTPWDNHRQRRSGCRGMR